MHAHALSFADCHSFYYYLSLTVSYSLAFIISPSFFSFLYHCSLFLCLLTLSIFSLIPSCISLSRSMLLSIVFHCLLSLLLFGYLCPFLYLSHHLSLISLTICYSTPLTPTFSLLVSPYHSPSLTTPSQPFIPHTFPSFYLSLSPSPLPRPLPHPHSWMRVHFCY